MSRFTDSYENSAQRDLGKYAKLLYSHVEYNGEIQEFHGELDLDSITDYARRGKWWQEQAKLHVAYGHLKNDGLMDDAKRNEYEALELRQAGYWTSEKLLEQLKQGGKYL